MTTHQITFIIDSAFINTSLAGPAVSHLCAVKSMPPEDVNKIELCVIEAVNNCIKHAYGQESGHNIEIILTFYPEKVEIKVCDTGISMDPLCLAKPNPPLAISTPVNIEDIPENGRGLFLIKAYMDSVHYERSSRKNCLIMTKKFGSFPSTNSMIGGDYGL